MNTWDYIERVRAKHGDCSDYRIALILGISKQALSRYRVAGTPADDEVAGKIAAELGIPAGRVLADIRIAVATASGNAALVNMWQSIREAFTTVTPIHLPRPARAAGGVMMSADPAMSKRRRATGGEQQKTRLSAGFVWDEDLVGARGFEPPTTTTPR